MPIPQTIDIVEDLFIKFIDEPKAFKQEMQVLDMGYIGNALRALSESGNFASMMEVLIRESPNYVTDSVFLIEVYMNILRQRHDDKVRENNHDFFK